MTVMMMMMMKMMMMSQIIMSVMTWCYRSSNIHYSELQHMLVLIMKIKSNTTNKDLP